MAVKVSKDLYNELTKIKESGKVDMHNVEAALEYAQEHNLDTASRAIMGNRRRYLKCIDEGMDVGS